MNSFCQTRLNIRFYLYCYQNQVPKVWEWCCEQTVFKTPEASVQV